jgi:hypothetical protein
MFVLHTEVQDETSESARRHGTAWESVDHKVIRVSISKIPVQSFVVVQVLAIVLNSKTDITNLCAFLHGVRVRDNLGGKNA